MATISRINYFRSSGGSVIALSTRRPTITKSMMTSKSTMSKGTTPQQKKKVSKPNRD